MKKSHSFAKYRKIHNKKNCHQVSFSGVARQQTPCQVFYYDVLEIR